MDTNGWISQLQWGFWIVFVCYSFIPSAPFLLLSLPSFCVPVSSEKHTGLGESTHSLFLLLFWWYRIRGWLEKRETIPSTPSNDSEVLKPYSFFSYFLLVLSYHTPPLPPCHAKNAGFCSYSTGWLSSLLCTHEKKKERESTLFVIHMTQHRMTVFTNFLCFCVLSALVRSSAACWRKENNPALCTFVFGEHVSFGGSCESTRREEKLDLKKNRVLGKGFFLKSTGRELEGLQGDDEAANKRKN